MTESLQGIFSLQRCKVMVTRDPVGANGSPRWHLSISHPARLPSYEELKAARYKFLPDDIYVAQIFPPQSEFVNLHPYCIHLYELGKDEFVP